jgi:hypothetical protein
MEVVCASVSLDKRGRASRCCSALSDQFRASWPLFARSARIGCMAWRLREMAVRDSAGSLAHGGPSQWLFVCVL